MDFYKIILYDVYQCTFYQYINSNDINNLCSLPTKLNETAGHCYVIILEIC